MITTNEMALAILDWGYDADKGEKLARANFNFSNDNYWRIVADLVKAEGRNRKARRKNKKRKVVQAEAQA